MKRIRLLAGTLAVAAVVGAVGCETNDFIQAPNGPEHVVAILSGLSEVPSKPTTTGYGSFDGSFSTSVQSMTFTLKVGKLVNLTQAHIHSGVVNANGPILVDLYLTPTIAAVGDDQQIATGTITPANIRVGGPTWDQLVTLVTTGGAYVNVHTTLNPGGEIRGQLNTVKGIVR